MRYEWDKRRHWCKINVISMGRVLGYYWCVRGVLLDIAVLGYYWDNWKKHMVCFGKVPLKMIQKGMRRIVKRWSKACKASLKLDWRRQHGISQQHPTPQDSLFFLGSTARLAPELGCQDPTCIAWLWIGTHRHWYQVIWIISSNHHFSPFW